MDRNIILITSAIIAVLAVVAAGTGLLSDDLYKNDTKSGAAQLKGSDLITLVLCVPLLLVSAYYAAKDSLRGRLIWTGTVFFFLYTYASLAFLAAYNQYFLIYVALFSTSLFTFATSLITLDVERVKESFAGVPVKVTAYFMYFIGIMVSIMWLGIIVGSLIAGERPAMLETYTTLVIQALDLGVVVPLAVLTGTLLLKKNAWGYALASIVLIKGITLGTAVLSMVLFMYLNGVEVVIPQVALFVLLVAGCVALTAGFYGKMKTSVTAVSAAA